MHTFHHTQNVLAPLDQVWSFFSNPANLSELTPKEMSFETGKGLPQKMYEGALLHYKVAPLLGIRITWVSEIVEIQELSYFIDEQRKGPFGFWRHEHRFREIENGTQIIDNLYYKMPFGKFGKLFHVPFVKKQVKHLFETRKDFLNSHFGVLS